MKKQNDIRQEITSKIIEALTNGKLPPWRQPWLSHRNSGFPTNVISGKRYSGVNPMLLAIGAERHGLRSKFWGTFKQWESIGGRVKHRPSDVPPGQWGTSIVFFKPFTKTKIDEDTGEEVEVLKGGLLKSYSLFSADQVEGVDHLQVTESDLNCDTFIDFEPAEQAINATGADIRFGGDLACYRRPTGSGDGDFIQMPHKGTFSPPSEYYATAFHELIHWSEYRLDWKGSYAEGELRAEIGACYALAELGVPQSNDMTNHHAYVKGWLDRLKSDPRFIFIAATAASKAADFVLGYSLKGIEATEKVAVLA